MKLALASVSAAVILIAGLSGCGDSDDGAPPAVEATPSADVLSGKELTCKNEIVRQMKDPSQETEDVPPECEGITEDRLFELIQRADEEIE
jgi:hypothetical protein